MYVLPSDFIDDWVKIGLPAKAKVLAENPHLTHEQQCRICERVSSPQFSSL